MDLLNLEPDPSRELEKTISFTAGFLLLERALQTRTDAGIIKPGGIGCYYLRNYCLPQIELSLTYEGEAATLASASSSFSFLLLSFLWLRPLLQRSLARDALPTCWLPIFIITYLRQCCYYICNYAFGWIELK